jgi:hypothetical protein
MRSLRGSTSRSLSTGRVRHARSAIGDRHIVEHRSSSTLPIGALSKGGAARLHSTDPILIRVLGLRDKEGTHVIELHA